MSPTARSTPGKTLAALRQMSSLGLTGRGALPTALDLLYKVVGVEFAPVFYVDRQFRVVDAHMPSGVPPAVLIDYGENFHNRPEGEGVTGMTTAQTLQSGRAVVHTSQVVARAEMTRTEFWNRIMRPLDMGWTCQLPLRFADEPVANIILSRPAAFSDFSAKDVRFMEAAQPWLSYLAASKPGPLMEDGDRPDGQYGVLVLDGQGRIVSANPGALQLFHQATGIPYVGLPLRRTREGDARDLLHRIRRAYDDALAGRASTPPACILRNPLGTFLLRVQALDALREDGPRTVALCIERRVPIAQQLFRSPRFLALSPRERDVCLGMLAGRSHGQIAQHLGIGTASVLHHIKSLYVRLGVSNQKQLMTTLLEEG